MEVITDFPERLKRGTTVYIGAEHRTAIIGTVRPHPEGLLVTLVTVDMPEAAQQLRRQAVYVKAADRPPLPKGMYYHHELIGFAIVNEQDELIGTLSQILQTGANDVYVVSQDEGGEILLPVISSVVLSVEREHRQIRIREMPGLLPGSHKPSGAN
jgi:16S rRNA processing protein RimM